MALGGKVHDDIGRKLGKGLLHRSLVADVGLQEGQSRIVRDRLEIVAIAGIGQLVDDQDLMRRLPDQVSHHGPSR